MDNTQRRLYGEEDPVAPDAPAKVAAHSLKPKDIAAVGVLEHLIES